MLMKLFEKGLSSVVETRSRYLGYGFLLLALIILFIAQAFFWGFVQDDAYISLRYARNLVQGQGIVFNPGERVEGYSNFSWMLYSTFFIYLGVDPIDALTISSALSGIPLLLFSPYLMASLRGQRRSPWDELCALLLASSTTLALWSLSALEQCFFALICSAGLLFVFRRRYYRAALCFFLAMLTRPEGLLSLRSGC